MKLNHELSKLAVDIAKNRITKYSQTDASEVLRQELIELNGGSDKITPKSFRNNPQLFEVLEEALDVLVVSGLQEQFDDFVETIELDWGDTRVFTVDENRIFDVALVSDGNLDIRRERIDKGSVSVRTKTYAIGIYEELHRLMAGKVDWPSLVERVGASYNNKIKTEIYNSIYNSFPQLNPVFQYSGGFLPEELIDMVSHVEASTGAEAMILGTKSALSRITTAELSDSMIEQRNRVGYLGMFNGTPMVEIRQAHRPNSYDWAIDNNFLIVAPMLENRFVKLILEGESIIEETTENTRNDMQRDYKFIKKAGFAVISSSNYGIYRMT
jgi:hypothetical protein